jgi:uncharacterized protein
MQVREFNIPIADLDAGGRSMAFPVRAAWLRGALEDTEATAAGTDGALDVRVSRSGNDVVVRGHVKADVSVPCARCLAPVSVHINHEVTALMVPAAELVARSRGEDDEADLENAELDVLPYHGETVALDELVRDELVLEIPMIPLCSEDCPGITPPPQNDSASEGPQAIDPRLAPLLRLKTMNEKKE